MFQHPWPTAPEEETHQPLQAASTRVSRASPPWGRRDWSDRHPVDLGQDTARKTGPVLFQASATHTFLNPWDSLSKQEAELLKRTASLNPATSRLLPCLSQRGLTVSTLLKNKYVSLNFRHTTDVHTNQVVFQPSVKLFQIQGLRYK